MKAWPFLVSRNFEFDYRTVVSPDILLDSGDPMLLAKAAGGKITNNDVCIRRKINGSALENLTLIYRVILIKKQEIGLDGDDYVRDEHGREISFIEGFALNETWELDSVPLKVFDSIHSFVVERYKEFWKWDDFKREFEAYESSQSLILEKIFENEDNLLRIEENTPFSVESFSRPSSRRSKEFSLVGKIPLVNGRSCVEFSPFSPENLGISAAKLTQIWALNKEPLEAIRNNQFEKYIKHYKQRFFVFEDDKASGSNSKRLVKFQEDDDRVGRLFFNSTKTLQTEIKLWSPITDKKSGSYKSSYKFDGEEILKFVCSNSSSIIGMTKQGLLLEIDLATGSSLQGKCRVFNGQSGELEFNKVALSQKYAAVATNKQIKVYEIPSFDEFCHPSKGGSFIDRRKSARELTTIELSILGAQMAIGYAKGPVLLRDISDIPVDQNGEEYRRLGDFQSPVTALSFSRDKQLIAIGMSNSDLSVFDISKPGEEKEIFHTSTKSSIDSLAFNCDSSLLVSSGTGSSSFAHIFQIS